MILCSQHAEVMHSNTDTIIHEPNKAEKVLPLHICLREGSEYSAVDLRMSWQDWFVVVVVFDTNPDPQPQGRKGIKNSVQNE